MDIVSYDHADTQSKRISAYYYVGESEPTNPEVGMEWSIPSTGKLYKRINDGTSDIWLDISSAGVGALNRSEEFIVGTPSNGYNGSTTTFPVAAGYIPGQLSVFVEGMKLNSDEYTATDGTNVILNVARIAGESVYVLAFGIFQVADTYSISGADAAFVSKTSATGSAKLPVGTTAQRDAIPTAGMLRWNSDNTAAEAYDGSIWKPVGGAGATGGGTDQVFYLNDQVINDDYTIPTGQNAMTAGSVTVNDGVTVTIPSGSTWTIV